MKPTKLSDLRNQSQLVRQEIIKMLLVSGSGHSAGPLGVTDILVSLYSQVLRHRPDQPDWSQRDYFLLSNGHVCPALYATLAVNGYFPLAELAGLRQLGARLQGHPDSNLLPGLEICAGPLGQGISQAVGLALGLRLQHQANRVFVLSSDGEHQEGQTWEAYQLAAHQSLDNLICLIDRNQIQISGRTEEVVKLEPFAAKLRSFGWLVLEIDGHDHQAIIEACQQPHAHQPQAIICHTVPGKGVSFMENRYEWHGKTPNAEQAAQALQELAQEETA